jgi:hypothetical protein
MITGKLSDFRRCERAEIVCNPFALVGGRNEAGKSSLAQAFGAALCNENQNLPPGFAKSTVGLLITAGQSSAQIELRSEQGWVRVDWPACTATIDGEPPHSSKWAAGVESIAEIDVQKRARVLAEYLKSDPTREDLATALADVELGGEKILDVIWKLIDEQGWDQAHTLRGDVGKDLKGRWRQETRANWGPKLAQSWRPDGWEEDLDGASEANLAAAVVSAKAAHDAAVAAAAISGAERQRLEQAADQAEELIEALAKAEIEEARLEEVALKAQADRAALPPGGADAEMACPGCGCMLVLRPVDLATRKLELAETLTAAEKKKRRQAIAVADGAVGNATAAHAEQEKAVERARHAMQIAVEARNRLAEMKPPGDDDGVDIDATNRAVGAAEDRLARWRQYRRAVEIRAQINGNDLILKILAPDGLRARKLARVLELFNTRLGGLGKAAGWRVVEIQPDMMITYGGRPYGPQISSSAQYRVRTILQLALAQLDGSAMVVLDAAEILDAAARRELFALLDSTDLHALICMTLSRREQLPDLAEIDIGASYWIEDGICEQPLHAQREAAE